MKRVRESDSIKRDQGLRLQHFGKDIWKYIAGFDVQILLNLLQTSKSHYVYLGGCVNIFKLALQLNTHNVLTRGAQTAEPIEIFLHPMQWKIITKQHAPLSPNKLVQHVLQNNNSLLQNALDKAQLPSNFWTWRAVVTGGFARSLIIKAFRNISNLIPSKLNDEYQDIDIFTDYPFHDVTEIVDFFGKSVNPPDSRIANIPSPNLLSKTHPIQIICPGQGLMQSYSNGSGCNGEISKLVKGFDFTCTQISIHGKLWWRNEPLITVTPAFLYSLFTGNTYLSYFKCVTSKAWPFDTMNTIYPHNNYEHCYDIKNTVIVWLHKKSFLLRLLKYQTRGYVDVLVTQEQVDVMKGILQKYEMDLQKHGLIKTTQEYTDMFDFLKMVFKK